MTLVLALALAVLVGASLGLLGGGGSILAVPTLRYVLGLEAHQAIAASLLVVGTTSLAALIPHALRGRVRWRTGVVFGAAGMLGAFLAGRVAHFIPAVVLLGGFALMMFATAFAMLRPRPVAASGAPAPTPAPTKELPIATVLLEGVSVGAISGLVGAGGGFLIVPALVLLGNLPMELAVGTSLVVISMQSFAGFVGYAGTTEIDGWLAFAMSAAAVAGSVAGGLLAVRVHPSALRGAFGWFVVVMAFFILGQEVPLAFGRTLSPGLTALGSIAGTGLLAVGRAAFRRGQRRSESRPPADVSRLTAGSIHPQPATGGKSS